MSYNNDYYVAIDENGQPYIEHALGDRIKAAWGSKSGNSPKFLEKFPNLYGNGKDVYAYTQDQVDRFRRYMGLGGKKRMEAARSALDTATANRNKAGQRFSKVQDSYNREKQRVGNMNWDTPSANAGNASRTYARFKDEYDKRKSEYEDANRTAMDARREAQRTEDEWNNSVIKRLGDKASTLKNSLRKRGGTTLATIRNAPKNAADRFKDWAGYDEKADYEQALKIWRNMQRQGTPTTEAQREGKWQQGKKLEATKAAYDKSLVGRVDKLKDSISSITNYRKRRRGHHS